MRRRLLIPALAATLALAGCTPVGTFLGSVEPQITPTATASPTAIASPEPTTGPCDDAVLDQPGEYHLPDCIRLTIVGNDIEVNAGSVGTLIIRGHANEVDAGRVGTVTIIGHVNDLDTLDATSVDIRGNYNDIGVHGSVGRVVVDGHDNELLADGDVGAVEDRGDDNVVGST